LPVSWDGVSWLGAENMTMYRTDFKAPAGSSSCVLYVCGLGYSVVSINGAPLPSTTMHLVTAPWTNTERINGFASVDISGMLNADGNNTIGVQLGEGWRGSSFPDRDNDRTEDPINTVLRAQIVLMDKNRKATVISHTGDGSWKASGTSPVTASSVYNGEDYDARVQEQLGGWDAPHRAPETEDDWAPAAMLSTGFPKGEMVPWTTPPVAVTRVIKPVSITEPKTGVFVVDFGENLAGVSKLVNIKCTRGSTITLKHAEILQHAGIPGWPTVDPTMIYQANLRTAQATDRYTCAGGDSETWYPRLTYHGFRFVEVNTTGSGVAITKDNIEMLHFHSNVKARTNVTFSSATFTQLQRMAVGAQRSNLMTVPTDCDQRDERLGWMGDANLSSDSMLLNFDLSAFFQFFTLLMRSELDTRTGTLTDTVPFARYGGRPGDVSWTTAFTTIIHGLWRATGKVDIIREYLDAMLLHLGNVRGQAKSGLGKMHTPYGDWCPPPAKMGGGQGPKPPSAYTSAFSYLDMVDKMGTMATAIGNNTLSATLAELKGQLWKDFNASFPPDSTGSFESDRHTSLVLALQLGTCPDVAATRAALVASLKKSGMHYNTGIIGFKFLFDQLYAAGEEDMASTVLSQLDYPSIGYYFANAEEKASTNLWELPDAPREGTGMNSRNHHMWSSYSAYLVKHIAGLDTDHPQGAVLFRPGASRLLGAANVSSDSAHGPTSLRWQRVGGVHADKVAEGYKARLDCGPGGGTISEVLFASYGTPVHNGGDLSDWAVEDGCHAPNSRPLIEAMCVGQTQCEVQASSSLLELASSCATPDKPLQLWVQARCSAAESLSVSVEVPHGASGVVTFPVYSTITPGSTFAIASGHGNMVLESIVVADLPVGISSVDVHKDHANRDVATVTVLPGHNIDFVLK